MNQPAPQQGSSGGAPRASRRQLLAQLDRALRQAADIVWQLREIEESGYEAGDASPAPAPPPAAPTPFTPAPAPVAPVSPTAAEPPIQSANEPGAPSLSAAEPVAAPEVAAANRTDGLAAFERVWDRISHEKMEQQKAAEEQAGEQRSGIDALPQQYLVTVEDAEASLDLVSLHRTLLGLAQIEEFSLVSYVNGVPVISIRSEGELDTERLGAAVGAAFDRDCEVIDQENGKLFLRLTARKDGQS